jgi:hypothetical protein
MGAIAAQLQAYVFCDGATPPVMTTNRRITSVTRAGAGDFTVNLDRAIDATELMPIIVPGSVGIIPRIVNTNDTAKQLLFINNAAAATDSTFYAAFWQVAWGGH